MNVAPARLPAPAPRPAADRHGPPPRVLGQILLARGRVSGGHLARALALQPGVDCRIGELLAARGWCAEADVARALAEQWGGRVADLDAEPPEPSLLPGVADAGLWIENRVIPWRREDGGVVFVTDDPARLGEALGRLGLPRAGAAFAVATRGAMDRALLGHLGEGVAHRAATRTPLDESVRGLGSLRLAGGAGLLALGGAAVLGGHATLAALAALLFLLNATTGLLRLAALVAGWAAREPAEAAMPLARLPRLSLLVPLYREARMVPEIVAALEATDYPRELLDVKILVETDDAATRAALAGERLPFWIGVLAVPPGAPRTKPRALNAALDFCRGDIVGVLDAEDRPGADQFRRVAHRLATAPEDVACVQCELAYFNAGENWITRCFQIEYAMWFGVLLGGFRRLGLPIPLGGTSVYFRRSALRAVGGWDAHNVTEDADLGMRLARRGMRCEMVGAVTEEEASCRVLPWIRQRSRWLKGYLLTWLSHMRAPRALWRELGPLGFLGLNALLLGGAASYLAMPLFWGALAASVLTGGGLWGDAVPPLLLAALGVSLGAGQAVMLAVAVRGVVRRGGARLLLWVPLLPAYWTLGAIAAWKAVFELFAAPYYWDKTRHGVSRCFAR